MVSLVRVRGRSSSVALGLALLILSCSRSDPDRPLLTTERPLHLEDHLDVARVEGSAVPTDVPDPVEWRFDRRRPEWKALKHYKPFIPPPRLEYEDDALRISLDERHRDPRSKRLHADIYVDLPDLMRADWSHVLVRARASEEITDLRIGFNLEPLDEVPDDQGPSRFFGDLAVAVNDGTVQTYALRADWDWLFVAGKWKGPWRQLILGINARAPSSLEILSVELVPKAAVYADTPFGVRSVEKGKARRRALVVHAPARVEQRVEVPANGRLDFGLGVLRRDRPVRFRVEVAPDVGEPRTLFDEAWSDPGAWGQRSVDLAPYAGRSATLALDVDAEHAGDVAFWAAPTLSGELRGSRPNVIFYVLDGGGADYMSVYGYNRRTTPYLERLAAEGAVFERAYSNSSWSKTSTTSFMTSLQNSVLGNTRDRFDPLPPEAVTMAERFHGSGYQTAVFTSNPWAGSMSSLDRGVDVMRDAGVENESTSSAELHRDFWAWRESYPAQPYWVHFQTTDPHEDYEPVPPFRGLFVPLELEQKWREWDETLSKNGDHGVYSKAYEKTGLSRPAFFALQQGMFDEALAHNDYQIGRLVERLKASGEWENTLFVVTADHSAWAAMDDIGIGVLDTLPPSWSAPMFRPSVSRVPLIVVWPGRIPPGSRVDEAVSLIDVLPTVVELADLPRPEIQQGQSLVPLLMGRPGWERRPVILDQFQVDHRTGELRGLIEAVDGRWGASLWIGAEPTHFETLLPSHDPFEEERPSRLLLYDLWDDPMALLPANERYPERVEHYGRFLEAQWAAHRALAQRFTPGGRTELSPQQLDALRALGYIQ